MTPILICMRLASMDRVHPDMVTKECSLCRHAVGVYPSGQRVLATFNAQILCDACRPPADVVLLAPGAEAERSQSVKRQ